MGGFKIFYTGMFRFPDMDAAGKRVHKIVDMLELIDECESIYVGGWEQGTDSEKKVNNKTTHISFSVLDKKKGSKIEKLINFLFMGMKVVAWMILNKEKYTHVIIYNTPFLFSLVVLLLGKLFNKKIILDSTEWYESEHLIGGKYGAAALENWCRMHIAYPLFRNVIAISTYLEQFYNSERKNIIKIPPLSDSYKGKANRSNSSDKVIFFYAGSPGKKDRLDSFVGELLHSKKAQSEVIFYIAGIDKSQFLNLYPDYRANKNELDMVCVFLGRIPMQEVFTWYSKIDYCVFFREDKRYAKAGFPSKYVEALSYGVPVITNAIGDISEEIKYTGIEYHPTNSNVDNLIDIAKEQKVQITSSLKTIFEENYSVYANLKKFKEFIRLTK
ncbi:Lipopolysaccharide biosynthesis RfbU-related protein [Cronobacter condimenti 1330]|uniref:Lipopolysaccharide biosynthesis RfbU-related protein n=1 Tax=Cronobacter condimenti 1330 TaxID=1073999 RepID=K8AG57_9ENTR|nr:glycosyltransferase [Cronobacter condimenti]ALB63277.1 lipopolysaccharide biosynthesis protein RfbU [Cronobacter condimenti 1330]CCJ74774.1 Lipopolysaccharide biosynthesis RfbU-related protein [Cronobacter condimenti 1330]